MKRQKIINVYHYTLFICYLCTRFCRRVYAQKRGELNFTSIQTTVKRNIKTIEI